MEMEINENKEEYTDFYWIVRRNLKIYEGDLSCTGTRKRRNQNCYDALKRRKIRTKNKSNGIIKYELSLIIDKLEKEDVEEPIFLVKDYREVLCDYVILAITIYLLFSEF